MFNLRSGISTLPQALHKTLADNDVDVRLSDGCTKLEHIDGKMKVCSSQLVTILMRRQLLFNVLSITYIRFIQNLVTVLKLIW